MAQWNLTPAFMNQMRPQAGFGGGPGYRLGGGVRFGENGQVYPPSTAPGGGMQPGAGFGMPGDMMGINPPQMPGRGGAGQFPPNMMGINPPSAPPGGGMQPGTGFGMPGDMMGLTRRRCQGEAGQGNCRRT